MTANGVVLSCNQNFVTVEIRRNSACTGNCTDCAGCSTPKMQVCVYTEQPVSPGDRVVVRSNRRAVLFGLFVLFIFPLLLPTAIYFLTVKSGFGGWFALVAVAVSIFIIWRMSKAQWFLKRIQPQIVEVLK